MYTCILTWIKFSSSNGALELHALFAHCLALWSTLPWKWPPHCHWVLALKRGGLQDHRGHPARWWIWSGGSQKTLFVFLSLATRTGLMISSSGSRDFHLYMQPTIHYLITSHMVQHIQSESPLFYNCSGPITLVSKKLQVSWYCWNLNLVIQMHINSMIFTH